MYNWYLILQKRSLSVGCVHLNYFIEGVARDSEVRL